MSQPNVDKKPEQIMQEKIDAQTAPVDIQTDDPSEMFEKMKQGVDKVLADRKEGGDPAKPKPAAEAPPVAKEPASGTPSPAPVSLPQSLLQRAARVGWTDDDLKGETAASLEKAVSKAEQFAAAALLKSGPEPKKEEKPKEPTLEEIWAKERELYPEAERGLLDKLVAVNKAHEAELVELRKVKGWAEHQHREQQATHLTAICDDISAGGYEDFLGKGRPKAGTEAYRNHGIIGHLLAADLHKYAELGVALDQDQIREAGKAHAKLLWGAGKVKAPEAEPPPPPAEEVKPTNSRQTPPKDPVTGKFVATERPAQREHEEGSSKGFDHAVRMLKKRNAAASVMGLSNGYANGGDIHDQP